jgi:hypothetical protein
MLRLLGILLIRIEDLKQFEAIEFVQIIRQLEEFHVHVLELSTSNNDVQLPKCTLDVSWLNIPEFGLRFLIEYLNEVMPIFLKELQKDKD